MRFKTRLRTHIKEHTPAIPNAMKFKKFLLAGLDAVLYNLTIYWSYNRDVMMSLGFIWILFGRGSRQVFQLLLEGLLLFSCETAVTNRLYDLGTTYIGRILHPQNYSQTICLSAKLTVCKRRESLCQDIEAFMKLLSNTRRSSSLGKPRSK